MEMTDMFDTPEPIDPDDILGLADEANKERKENPEDVEEFVFNPPTQDALDLHEVHKVIVVEFLEKCQSLGIGFGNEVIMAAKIDALVDLMLGPRYVGEDGVLLEGSIQRISYEVSVANHMLEMAQSHGVEAALLMDPLIMPNGQPVANRNMRRGGKQRPRGKH